MTQLGAIDDASGQVLALHFRPTEDLHGYLTLCLQLFTSHGLPLALYGDRLNVFVRTDRHWTLAEQLHGTQQPTHFGRLLAGAGHRLHRRALPPAKGRVGRLWQTLQDRLVSELRLRGIATRAEANAFLPTFIADFSQRFAVPPADPTPVWRRPPRALDRLLSCRYSRRVASDNTVTLGARCVQLRAGRAGTPTPRGAWRCASCSTGGCWSFTLGSASPRSSRRIVSVFRRAENRRGSRPLSAAAVGAPAPEGTFRSLLRRLMATSLREHQAPQ